MAIRGQLLTYFISIILITMVTFGLIAYEIAKDTAIKKEKYLFKGIVELQSNTLAAVYKENPEITHMESYIETEKNSDHISFLINNNDNILTPGQLIIEGRDYRKFPINEVIKEKAYEGELTVDDQLYLWVRTSIPESPYDLIRIFRSSYIISAPFASLSARLVVTAIIIIWVAVWVALIISTAVSRRLKVQTQALEYQTMHDDLTGLPNRKLLHKRLEQVIRQAKRTNKQVSLIIMDLDRFKDINDTLGHHIGDLLLKKVGKRLSGILNKTATIARFGGDEFAILLPKTDPSHAMLVVDNIVKALDASFKVENSTLEIDASLGVAYYPEHGKDATTLMRRADVAMYMAKHGAHEFAIYDHSKDPNSLERLSLMHEMRHATENNELILLYQPKVDVKSAHIMGAEALLYWQHPQHGLMKPDSFIPLAEQTGLIKPLTLWVLHTAVKQCADLQKAGIQIAISVNLSAIVLQDLQVPAQISAILDNKGLPAELLELEITESTIMTDPQRAMEILTRLDKMGVRLSIDDFGTGYTSLSYLKQLPVDDIKIDKSFVMNMCNDENDAIIVRSIIDLAHNMGRSVTAEGVETKAILATLEEYNCDSAQGFYITRPLPAVEFEQFLIDSSWPVITKTNSEINLENQFVT